MPPQDLNQQSDEQLVANIRDPKRTTDLQVRTAAALAERYKPKLLGALRRKVFNLPQFLAAVECNRQEDFCADCVGKAVISYNPSRGAKFSTWLYEIFHNAVVSGFRRRKTFQPRETQDGVNSLETLPSRAPQPGSLAHLAFIEIRELARKCINAMPEKRKTIFVWGEITGLTPSEIRDLRPDLSTDNIKQIKHRALVDFLTLWEKHGGARAEQTLESAAAAMAEKIDVDLIKDKRARDAYRRWIRDGNLAAAARDLNTTPQRLRKLLLSAMRDIFNQAMYRGDHIDPKALKTRGNALAAYLDLSEGIQPKDPLLERIRRTLDTVRAAFGLAPPDRAIHTLGSFIQEKLLLEEDYDAACRALDLKPAALRGLLADEYQPDGPLYRRLARLLNVDEKRLRALPRRPAEPTATPLRSRADFDDERFYNRVIMWITRPRPPRKRH